MSDPKPECPGRGNNPNKRVRISRVLLGCSFSLLVCVALFFLFKPRNTYTLLLSIDDVKKQLEADNVRQVILDGHWIRGEFKKPVVFPDMKEGALKFRAEIPPNANAQVLGLEITE